MSHIPVLAQAVLQAFGPQPDGLYVDGTFGRGGHARLILDKLSSNGKLHVFDKDLAAIDAANKIQDKRLIVHHQPFSKITDFIEKGQAAGILLDLGISSPQIDTPERGFSYRFDGPLDMRMDQTQGQTAAEWLAGASSQEIARVLKKYGDERFANNIAKNIVNARQAQAITTTEQLRDIIDRSIPKKLQDKHPSVRSFQAIRMHINDEMGELEKVLAELPEYLVPGGVLAIITFHSIEDRFVKRAFQKLTQAPNLPNVPTTTVMPYTMGKKQVATADELAHNPRAHSAILRTLIRRQDDATLVSD